MQVSADENNYSAGVATYPFIGDVWEGLHRTLWF